MIKTYIKTHHKSELNYLCLEKRTSHMRRQSLKTEKRAAHKESRRNSRELIKEQLLAA